MRLLWEATGSISFCFVTFTTKVSHHGAALSTQHGILLSRNKPYFIEEFCTSRVSISRVFFLYSAKVDSPRSCANFCIFKSKIGPETQKLLNLSSRSPFSMAWGVEELMSDNKFAGVVPFVAVTVHQKDRHQDVRALFQFQHLRFTPPVYFAGV
jgi:hypothetical protein